MTKSVFAATLASLFILSGPSFAAECSEPGNVMLPDGATATTDEMVAGQQAVKKYIADGEAFLSCLEDVEKNSGDQMSDEVKKSNVERYNAVVDQMQVLAQNFNEQIKAYKAAQAEQ